MSWTCLRPFPPCSITCAAVAIRNSHHDEVTIGLTLLRESLSEVEGEGVRRDSGSLLCRAFLFGRLGLQRGRGGVSAHLAFGRKRSMRGRRHRDGANTSLVGRLESKDPFP